MLSSQSVYISSLNLANNSLGEVGCELLAMGIANTKSLISLDLSSNGMPRKSACAVFSALGKNNSLVSLTLGSTTGMLRNKFDYQSMVTLGNALSVHNSLIILNLKSAAIGNAGVEGLTPGLVLSKSLQELNLSSNSLSSAGVPFVFKIISQSCIKYLDLSKNNLGEVFENKFKGSVTQTEITHLNISWCNFKGPGAMSMLEGIKALSSIKTLELDGILIEEFELSYFTKFLKNDNLKSFSIKSSKLGNTGIMQIADGLFNNQILQEIYLSNNMIKEEGATKLLKAITDTPRSALKVLDLSLNMIEVIISFIIGYKYARFRKSYNRERKLEYHKFGREQPN